MDKAYYSTEEVAQLLSFDKLTIRRWINSGKVNAVKINTEWRIPESEVKRLQGKD